MDNKELTFENAMARLEEIVGSLESGDFALDKSLSLFEEGIKLVRLCNNYLEKAESSVGFAFRVACILCKGFSHRWDGLQSCKR